jgi:hypothetical protein
MNMYADIDKLVSGPELDRLVAEKVMGLIRHDWVEGCGQAGVLSTYEGCSRCERERRPAREDEPCIRAYSTDIADAMDVFEKMRSAGWAPEIWAMKSVSRVRLYVPEKFEFIEQEEQTIPLAICRAALKALL